MLIKVTIEVRQRQSSVPLSNTAGNYTTIHTFGPWSWGSETWLLRRNIEARAEQALRNGFSLCMLRTLSYPQCFRFLHYGSSSIRALLSTWYMSTLCWKHEMHGLSLSRPLIHVQQAINLVATHFAKKGCLLHKSILWQEILQCSRDLSKNKGAKWTQPMATAMLAHNLQPNLFYIPCVS